MEMKPQRKLCHLFNQSQITENDINQFEIIETFSDESHEMKAVKRCKVCGQLFLYTFYEIENWQGGDDEMYGTYVQVDSVKEAKELLKSGKSICNLNYSFKTEFRNGIWSVKANNC